MLHLLVLNSTRYEENIIFTPLLTNVFLTQGVAVLLVQKDFLINSLWNLDAIPVHLFSTLSRGLS